MSEYSLIIHTDKYAGNFVRGLTAHLTGVIGYCGVGEDYINGQYPERFKDIVIQKPDENGCNRPCAITTTDNSLVTEDELMSLHNESIQRLIDSYQKYIDIRLGIKKQLESGEKVGNWTLDAIDKENARDYKRIEEIKKDKDKVSPNMCLYFAVEIYFSEEPTEQELDFIKDRLETFGEKYKTSYHCSSIPVFKRIDLIKSVKHNELLKEIDLS